MDSGKRPFNDSRIHEQTWETFPIYRRIQLIALPAHFTHLRVDSIHRYSRSCMPVTTDYRADTASIPNVTATPGCRRDPRRTLAICPQSRSQRHVCPVAGPCQLGNVRGRPVYSRYFRTMSANRRSTRIRHCFVLDCRAINIKHTLSQIKYTYDVSAQQYVIPFDKSHA